MSVQGLETERDFYFSKLREIELICQENEGLPILQQIMDVMYATQVRVITNNALCEVECSGDGCVEVKAGVTDCVCMIEREREREPLGGG